jgi:hypothetical protein
MHAYFMCQLPLGLTGKLKCIFFCGFEQVWVWLLLCIGLVWIMLKLYGNGAKVEFSKVGDQSFCWSS